MRSGRKEASYLFMCVSLHNRPQMRKTRAALCLGAAVDLVESGEVQAFVAQPLYEEAQTSVIALDTLLRGNSYPFFTSLDAPLVTRANMDRYRKLLQDVNNWYA